MPHALHVYRELVRLWSKKGQKGTMSELLANALPHVAAQEGNENWDEEEPYESGILCPSEGEHHIN